MVSVRAEHVIGTEIGKYFELEKASIGLPDLYLGGEGFQGRIGKWSRCIYFQSKSINKISCYQCGIILKDEGTFTPSPGINSNVEWISP